MEPVPPWESPIVVIGTISVYLRVGIASPTFPDRCVVCGQRCGDEREPFQSSVTQKNEFTFSLFGKVFLVSAHHQPCGKRLKRIWKFWQYGFFVSVGVGLLLSVPIEIVTNYNAYAGMVAALGLPMATIVIAFLVRDLSPLQVFEISDGSLYKFVFKHAAVASEFRKLNLGMVADGED